MIQVGRGGGCSGSQESVRDIASSTFLHQGRAAGANMEGAAYTYLHPHPSALNGWSGLRNGRKYWLGRRYADAASS